MTAIVRLFAPCSPADVARLVIAIVVDSVEREPSRAQSYVGKEIGEPMPTCTHRYAPPAVVPVVLAVGIFASSQHRRPDVVFGGSGHAMRYETRPAFFAQQASATSRGSRLNVRFAGDQFGPAVASKSPKGMMLFRNEHLFQGYQSTKSPAGNIAAHAETAAPFRVAVAKILPSHRDAIPAIADTIPPRPQSVVFRLPNNNEAAKSQPGENHEFMARHTEIVTDWARQVQGRADRLAAMLRDGTPIAVTA